MDVTNMPRSTTRNKHTPEQIEILQRYKAEGMKAYNTSELRGMVKEAAQEAKLHIQQVKNWIGKERKKSDLKAGIAVRRKAASLKPRRSTRENDRYRLFMSKHMRGKGQETYEKQRELFSSAAKAWAKAKKNKKVLAGLDKELQNVVLAVNPQQMTPTQKRNHAAKIMKQIGKLSNQLDDLGYSTVVMASHPELGHEISGNEFGRTYIKSDKHKLIRSFHMANGATAFVPRGSTKIAGSEEGQRLRKEVREMLNEKCSVGTNYIYHAVPYQAIIHNTSDVRVEGWPSRIKFRNVSHIGVANLKNIWQLREQIKFTINEDVETNSTQGIHQEPERNSIDEDEDSNDAGDISSRLEETPEEDGDQEREASEEEEEEDISSEENESDEEDNDSNEEESPAHRLLEPLATGLEKRKVKKAKQSSSSSGVHEAERILDSRSKRGQIEYLVKWLGYTKEKATWEPEQNILTPSLIRKFFKRVAKK